MSDRIGTEAIRSAIAASKGPAVCAYITGGYPDEPTFVEVLKSVAAAADVVEVGVPFTDPMADGLTIQRAGLAAIDGGVTLSGILEVLRSLRKELEAPILLMGYYNPFLAYGFDRLGSALEASGVSGLIVPDLPFEESTPMRAVLEPRELALVQLVTPSTPGHRLRTLATASTGFVYAVTVKGVTGGRAELSEADLGYLGEVREASDLPVLAGFGIRRKEDVARLAPHVDGVVVGSALIEAIDNGDDPGKFVAALRPSKVAT